MDTIQILIFNEMQRLSFIINEKEQVIKDVTSKHADENLIQIMSIISHKKIEEALKCLQCDNIKNQYSKRIIDILKIYTY